MHVSQLFIILLIMILVIPTASSKATPNNHEQINGPFANAQAVTTQCLGCHAQQGVDILQSSHWTWQRSRRIGTATLQPFAKRTSLTTFAIDVEANPGRCMTCHISTNLLSGNHDPASAAHIDCLVCHDTTGTYHRTLGAASTNLDLVRIARKVGTPRPNNCLTCHGKNCGLTDLSGHDGFIDDIHLGVDGAGLTCQQCHPSGGQHSLSRQGTATDGIAQASGCASCHTDAPHARKQLNQHATTIGCSTCHIPVYGRGTPAILSWNWLTQPPREIYQQENMRSPLLQKNGIALASLVQPVYFWDNGNDRIYERGNKIDPTKITPLQQPGPRDASSQIKPFAALYGTQLYDVKYRYLISPALTKDTHTFFISSEWDKIASEGMNGLRLPYSGSSGFAATVLYRRLSHGIAPAAQALDCLDCHGKQGRLPWHDLGYRQDPWIDQDPEPTQAPQQSSGKTPAPPGQDISPSETVR